MALFAWAVTTEKAEANPVTGTIRASGEVSREHVIADEELTAIRQACRDDDYGQVVWLLILTDQRRDEVGGQGLCHVGDPCVMLIQRWSGRQPGRWHQVGFTAERAELNQDGELLLSAVPST